jgi:hypothetical protein
MRRPPSVDVELCTCDVRGVAGREERDDRGGLVGTRESPHRPSIELIGCGERAGARVVVY